MSSTPYQYADMCPDPQIFLRHDVASTGDHLWSDWKSHLVGSKSGPWRWLNYCYTPPCKLAILRAATVFGLPCQDWNTLFTELREDRPPFQLTNKVLAMGRPCDTINTLIFLVLVDQTQRPIHYPPLYPAWLAHLGWRQQDYITDIWECGWHNVHDDYHHPWPELKLGEEWPEIERIKQLGEAARSEIDKVALHSAQQLKK